MRLRDTTWGAWLGALLLASSIAACHSTQLVPLGSPPGGATGATVTQSPRSFGQLSMTIRWPRQVQYIPVSATRIEFKAFVGENPVPYATQTATSPGVGGTSTVRFEALPAGEVVIVASAKDAADQVVAAGSIRLAIVANDLVRGALTLQSTTEPQITTFVPQAADPGSEVHLFGSHFGDEPGRNATYSVWVGGLVAPSATLVDDGTLRFIVPEGATNSLVTLRVDALATRSAQVFTTIRAWTLSPSSAEVFVPYGTQDFAATARDHAGVPVETPPSDSWSVVTVSGATGASVVLESDEDGSEPSELGVEFRAPEGLGTYQVRIGKGSAAKTATVTTHPMTFADFDDRLGILPAAANPADNPTSPEKVALGKRLFFDSGIGSNGQMSCASCHQPDKGWSDGRKTSLGNDGQPLERNSPTILNAGLDGRGLMFWDGRAATLEDQARQVFGNARELNRTGDQLRTYLTGAGYQASFSAVFGPAGLSDGTTTMDQVTKAIAAFERTVMTQQSAFDRWAEGDAGALGAAEKRGLGVFATRGRCIECHSGPMFTDEKFHNISVFEPLGVLNPGRKAVTGAAGDLGAFKTPTLRNIEETGPYFHNGSVANLTDVILHYEGEFEETPNIDPLLAEPIQISAQDREDLIAFLRALSGATPSVTP